MEASGQCPCCPNHCDSSNPMCIRGQLYFSGSASEDSGSSRNRPRGRLRDHRRRPRDTTGEEEKK